MIAPKHTPGPWNVIDSSWNVSLVLANGNERTVAACPIPDDATEETLRAGELEKEANARLIAAAPAMLACLREMSIEVHETANGMPFDPLHAASWANKIDYIIAAATGAA